MGGRFRDHEGGRFRSQEASVTQCGNGNFSGVSTSLGLRGQVVLNLVLVLGEGAGDVQGHGSGEAVKT